MIQLLLSKRLLVIIALQLALFHCTILSANCENNNPSSSSSSSWFSSLPNHIYPSFTTNKAFAQKDKDRNSPSIPQKKKSLLRIDPQKVISMICRYGGIILPKTIERDLKIIENTCHCEETSLDLINRELEMKNLTISIPMKVRRGDSVSTTKMNQRDNDSIVNDDGHDPALKVARICIKWDSYVQPCLSIEVDDVTILIEFVNLLLTRNNWNELQEIGFPPSFYEESQTHEAASTSSSTSQPSSSSSFITIESIDFSGKAIIKTHSRILNKELIQDVEIDLDNLDYLNDKIKDAAIKATKQNGGGGRKGCSIEEVERIIQTHFNELIRKLLKFAVADLAFTAFNNNKHLEKENNQKNESYVLSSMKDMKKAMKGTKDAFVKYAKDVGVKTTEDIGHNLAEIGFSEEQVNRSMDSINDMIHEKLFDRTQRSQTEDDENQR